MGVGNGVFKSPGRRLHLRAMNERSRQGPRAGPRAGPRPASLRLQHLAPRANSRGSLPSALQPTGLPTSPLPRELRRPPASPTGASADPFTFQQPLDDAVDVEFIYIRHRLPTAGPPAAAPPPARARDSHLLSHASSTEAVVAAVAAAAAGPPQPPRSLLPPSLPTGTTRRTKWPPTP